MYYDLIICTPPIYDNEFPILAPSIISSVVKSSNLKIKYINLNQDLYNKNNEIFDNDIKDWKHADVLFSYPESKALRYKKFNQLMDNWVDNLINLNPRYIGFSILSKYNFVATLELSKRIKKINKNIKIIIGGVATNWFKTYLEKNHYIDLIDHFIIGYAENIIVDLLKDKITDKIIKVPYLNLKQKVISDYSDYVFDDYIIKSIYTYTSRGCINHCTFCGVKDLWKDFNCRPLDHVIEEMNSIYKQYNIDTFKMADSIINARLNHLRKFCTLLKNYNYKWDAMFSIRSKMKLQDYKLLAESGCTEVYIGVESGSFEVRKHMGKHFTNSDLFKVLDFLDETSIRACLMFIIGYPTEEIADVELTKQLIEQIENRKYKIHPRIRLQPLSIENISGMEQYKNNSNFLKKYDRYIEIRQFVKEISGTTILQQDRRLQSWWKKTLDKDHK